MKKRAIVVIKTRKSFKLTAVPTLKGSKDDKLLWKDVAEVLDKFERELPEVKGDSSVILRSYTSAVGKGIFVFSHKLGKVIFIPWNRIDWSKLKLTIRPLTNLFRKIAERAKIAINKNIFFMVVKKAGATKAIKAMISMPGITIDALKLVYSPAIVPRSIDVMTNIEVRGRTFKGLLIGGSLKAFPGSEIGVFIPNVKDTLVWGYLKVPKSAQLSGIKLLKAMKEVADRTGRSRIWCVANVNEGRYMWARIGGQWATGESEKQFKKDVIAGLKRLGVENADDLVNDAKSPTEVFDTLRKKFGLDIAKDAFPANWECIVDLNSPRVKWLMKRLGI